LKNGFSMEMNRKYKGLFVTDLDGTLLTDNKKFSQIDLDALQLLQSQSYATAIATGRSQYSFCSLLENLNMRSGEHQLAIDYVVFSTGAGLMEYPGEKILEHISLQVDEVIAIAQYLEANSYDYMIHRAVPDTHHFLYRLNSRENPDFIRRLEIYSDFATPLPADGSFKVEEATGVICIVPGIKGEALTGRIQKAFPQCSVILATSPLDGQSGWIEIFSKSVSKSNTVSRLCRRLGLSQQQTCAVGNDFNDEDLLHWAPNSYLVENGPNRLKGIFPVVASNNAGGVSEAVNRWLENS
jgi:HAD superfamily hydrolase (TIGR01484 family)